LKITFGVIKITFGVLKNTFGVLRTTSKAVKNDVVLYGSRGGLFKNTLSINVFLAVLDAEAFWVVGHQPSVECINTGVVTMLRGCVTMLREHNGVDVRGVV
jgi:hypothetical protein